ncbi:m7GpppX diphosphatase-like [Argiope bruennichi]|uniref:m7GpppX diphosphatase n=1 Tax=Argiope bruennichi TaxID=94029 RepID=A0A8T0EZD3_ARGBR|nr:m7GpppX diphosphatase-like [Argiope bruennichi]KAF8782957.1 m7GpppX diphosphatase like protein [Argiope bruennichi]
MAVDLTTGSYDEAGVFSKHNEAPKSIAKKSIEDNMGSLKSFQVVKILKECLSTKSIVVEGRFDGDDKPAIIVLEKTPFDIRDISQLFTSDSRLELKFWNNIYGNYHVYPQTGFNGISVQVIHPATESDFLKFVEVPLIMVNETKDLYESAVLPYFKSVSEKIQDCINNSNDEDKTIYNDSGESSSFVLLKDDVEKCFCTSTHFRAKAVVSQKDILSLRCLSAANLPFLIKLQKKCLEELSAKYEVPVSKIETYITYPPASFPFHVFFETVEKDSSIPVEKAHSLTTVISNLQLIPDYYQRITLTYSLPESDPLLQSINEHKTNSAGKE